MQEIEVQSLGQKDTLDKGMATHSSILAREIPWTKEPGGLQSMGSLRVGHDRVHMHSACTPIKILKKEKVALSWEEASQVAQG